MGNFLYQRGLGGFSCFMLKDTRSAILHDPLPPPPSQFSATLLRQPLKTAFHQNICTDIKGNCIRVPSPLKTPFPSTLASFLSPSLPHLFLTLLPAPSSLNSHTLFCTPTMIPDFFVAPFNPNQVLFKFFNTFFF